MPPLPALQSLPADADDTDSWEEAVTQERSGANEEAKMKIYLPSEGSHK